MPIYEYRCASCGFQKEFLQKLSDPLHTICPECGKESFKKMLTAAGFQLKGSGWYATDFKNAGSKPAARKPDTAKKDGGGDKSINTTSADTTASTGSDTKTSAGVSTGSDTKTKAAQPAASS